MDWLGFSINADGLQEGIWAPCSDFFGGLGKLGADKGGSFGDGKSMGTMSIRSTLQNSIRNLGKLT